MGREEIYTIRVCFHVFPSIIPSTYSSTHPSIHPTSPSIHHSPTISMATFSLFSSLSSFLPSFLAHPQLPHPHPPPLTLPQIPPVVVVAAGGCAAIEHIPAPLVDEVAEGQEGDLLQGHLQQVVDVALCMKQSLNQVGKKSGWPALWSPDFLWARR